MRTFSRPQPGWYIPYSVLGMGQGVLRGWTPPKHSLGGPGVQPPPPKPPGGPAHLYRGSLVSGLSWKVESP